MKIALAQIKPVTGDLEGNVEQIVRDIRKAKAEGADIVLFPEAAITGYCCGALFEQEDFVKYNKSMLEEIIAKEVPKDMVAVVGFVDIKGRRKDGHLDITNSAAILQGGRVVDVYDKILLANGNHHEDKKYFTSGKDVKVIEVIIKGQKVKIGTPICEDAWSNDHERDIVQEMKDKGAELILCSNQSYFYYGKMQVRHSLFGRHAKEKEIPVVVLNAVGVGDIVKNIMIYDGSSLVYDCNGNLVTQLKRFSEDLKAVDIDLKKPTRNPILPSIKDKYTEIFDALVFEQRELFRVIGLKNAQVHVSGGIDSAIVAALVAEAMGKEHTILITNPTEDNSLITRSNAQYIADQLGIKLYWNSTQEPYQSVVQQHEKAFSKEPSLTGKACIESVLRTVQGIGAYHHFKSGIVAAGNHTEIVEGWVSFHDIGSIGVHSLIGDLTKVELFEFAKYINQRLGKEVIPKTLYDGTIKPMAELADAREDPINYYVRSGIDAEIIRNRKSINDLVEAYETRSLTHDFFPLDTQGRSIYEQVDEKEFTEQVLQAFENSKHSVFKAAQAAPIVIISPRSRGFSNRETIINHYQGWYNINELKENMLKGVYAA